MKKLQFVLAAFILLFTLQSSAQVTVSVNIGSHPDWCGDYEDDVEYFYLPEIEAYYDTHASVFIYFGPGGWIRSAYLPDYCHGYDLHHGYKVALDYHGHAPYAYYNHHRKVYYRDYHRNYRQEYYHPNRRRSEYVAVANPRSYNYNDNNNHHNNNSHGNGHGHGNGNGHGNRRR